MKVFSLFFFSFFFLSLFSIEYDFELYDLNDKIISLKKTIQNPDTKLVVVDFISMFCEPCKKSVPFVNSFYKEHKSRGFRVIAVVLPSPDRKKDVELLKSLLTESKPEYPFVYDKYSKAGKQFKVVDSSGNALVPNLFLIDKSGKLIMNSKEFSEMIPKIKELL